MRYIEYSSGDTNGFFVLELEDWSEAEWATILKLFGLSEAERIVLQDYKVQAYGIPNRKFSNLMRRRCHFCEYDQVGRRKRCDGCLRYSEFKPKKRMHPRMKWEYDMWKLDEEDETEPCTT
jgi:hypothetical protein